MVAAVDRSAGFAQQLIRANLGTERIGWERPPPDVVLLPPERDAGRPRADDARSARSARR